MNSHANSSQPGDFDPAACPIIAKPFRPPSQIAAEKVADLRFRRQVQQLHDRGVRVVAELLAEIGAERSIQTVIDEKLDTYAELEPAALEATGGDGFWQPPLREV